MARGGTLSRRVHSASSTRQTLMMTKTTHRRQRGRAVRPVILDPRKNKTESAREREIYARTHRTQRQKGGRAERTSNTRTRENEETRVTGVTAVKRGRVHDARDARCRESRLYQREVIILALVNTTRTTDTALTTTADEEARTTTRPSTNERTGRTIELAPLASRANRFSRTPRRAGSLPPAW